MGAWLMACLLLQGCAGGAEESPSAAGNAKKKEAAPRATAEKPVEETAWDEDALRNDTGKTVIKSLTTAKTGAYHATIALVSKSGTAVIADPYDVPMDNGIPKADIVTISHRHPDHIDAKFLQKTKAKLSVVQAGERFTVGDINVTSVAAGHDSNFDPANPSDIIYIFEVDGMRIAHLGDLGQDELTDEQLQAIGRVDIVFTAIDGLAQYGRSAQKSIKALEQLHPSIIAATHYEEETVKTVLDALHIKDQAELEELVLDKPELDRHAGKQKYVLLK